MSTRATYRFRQADRDITFYIHYDGYPSGAASYFQNMLDREGRMQTFNHGLAEVFFRANERAEFTQGHDAHADTEYRYDIGSLQAKYEIGEHGTDHGLRWSEQVRHLTAYSRDYNYGVWRVFFTGTVEQFVAKYASGEHDE